MISTLALTTMKRLFSDIIIIMDFDYHLDYLEYAGAAAGELEIAP